MHDLLADLTRIYYHHQKGFSGAIVIAQGNEVLFSAASGYANRDFNIYNRTGTLFDTASVTKVFTAVATLQLVQRGMLRLDDPITEILDLQGTAIPQDVTVAHLLTHTSGIADDADEEAGESYAALFENKPNYSIRECRDFLPQFAYKPRIFPAGTDARYNNCAFILLGLAIETLTGQPYRTYVTENIFAPAGMTSTRFQAKDDICPNTAEGYLAVEDDDGQTIGWRKNIYSFPPIGTADSGAYTTADDLRKFWQALRGGMLLDAHHTAAMLQPQAAIARQSRYGSLRYGYALEFIERAGRIACICKDGINDGVSAMMSWYPPLDITLNLLSNQDGGMWAMHHEMRSALLDAMR